MELSEEKMIVWTAPWLDCTFREMLEALVIVLVYVLIITSTVFIVVSCIIFDIKCAPHAQKFKNEESYKAIDVTNEHELNLCPGDKNVFSILKLFKMTEFWEVCCSQNIDFEALVLHSAVSNEDLIKTFGLQEKNIESFRIMLKTAEQIWQTI